MLFGHQNNDSSLATPPAPLAAGVNPLAVDPATGVSLPVPPPALPVDEPETPSILNQPSPAVAESPATVPTVAFPSNAVSAPLPSPLMSAPAIPEPPVVAEPEEPDEPTPVIEAADTEEDQAEEPAASTPIASPDDLLALKAQALTQLSPLVDQLDQTPEEKFRTTMMLIQSTDDPSRIPAAYEAAQAIMDEKVRAQALLDIINEINYFTQRNGQAAED